ncbi:MAG: hypothetical protein JXA66_01895 [Oligoflexia bacterium]|nr:hypothetical protein [Oligoflexia bacterium]
MNKKNGLLSLEDKAEQAMKQAIRKLVKEHKKSGLPLIIWENGKVVKVKL